MAASLTPLVTLGFVLWLSWKVYLGIQNLYFSRLSGFPGPRLAGATSAWKTFQECFLNKSLCHALVDLHAQYGDVVRVGPNELHFANPKAYLDIYNNSNRWDKDRTLYHSFNEDRSSFGFLTYKEAKERKDVLNKMFSAKAVSQFQDLMLDKINALCDVYETLGKQGKPVDLNWSLRCMAMDIITYLCFGKSVDAMHEPDFRAPIIVAMDAALPTFTLFKHFEWYKNMIMNCPPNISKVVSKPTAGLVDLQQILGSQIKELSENPNNLNQLPHNMTIYHHLMNDEAYKNGNVPSQGSLYEEAQALMFAGSDTTSGTLMVILHHLLWDRKAHDKLKEELRAAWPKLAEPPTLRTLEQLPYFNAVLKEGLRMNSGVVSGLLRIVPAGGAKICDAFVPEGTSVSCGSTFVHYNADIFPSPHDFSPGRWLDRPDLDQWLVAFSKGPRSCLGINMAWQEMRLALAHILRRFDMQPDPSSPKRLEYRDTFLPFYLGNHVKARVTPVAS